MIVCSCNVLSEQEVRSAVCPQGGMARSPVEVYSTLGCSAQCGRCARTIKTIISEALREGCGTSCTRLHDHAHDKPVPCKSAQSQHAGHQSAQEPAAEHDAV